jgi:hypothetical protein
MSWAIALTDEQREALVPSTAAALSPLGRPRALATVVGRTRSQASARGDDFPPAGWSDEV